MKAINDYRILMPNIPYYETGIAFNEYEVVYYTGINPGTYTDYNTSPPITQTVVNPVAGKTGYYYLKKPIYKTSGENVFWTRPDSELNDVDSTVNFYDWWVQHFFFVPTYGSSVEFSANYYENTFQDNYKYILGKSENVIQVKAILNYQGISDNEARAINHFYQNYFTKDNLSYGQGMKPVEIGLFYPHEKSQPFYLKTVNNDFENVDFNNVTVEVESPFISLTSWKEKLIPFKSSQNYYYDTQTYNKNDYVFEYKSNRSSEGFFYYSGDSSSKNISPYSDSPDNHWTQKFYFSPDLVESLNFESLMYKNDLGNFYLNQSVGLNPNFLDFQLIFNNRSDKEAKAILHFFENHNGLDLFEYDMFPPYTGTRAFFCPEWSHTYNFSDNHTIKARIIESKFNYTVNSIFNSVVDPVGIDFGFVPIGFSKRQLVRIKNNENRPVTYTISSDQFKPTDSPNVDVAFVHQLDNESEIQTAQAGGYANYNIDCDLNLENEGLFANPVFKYTGLYQFVQEKENEGVIANNDLSLYYSGKFFDVGETISVPFLSGLKSCIASPYYDFKTNQLCLKTRFTIPESGYYFNNFSGRLTNTSGAFVVNQFTGSSIAVGVNESTDLYDIGNPGSSYFDINFSGLLLGTDYYVRVSGLNTNYLGENKSPFLFASGIDRITENVTNTQVISGLTLNNLANFNINPPSIRIDGVVETFNINDTQDNYFDLYKYIEANARFGAAFSLYSGVKINFSNVYYGPLTPVTDIDVFDTGVFIITGNYSAMPSGVELNFNNCKVIGKGGNTYKTKNINDPIYSGKNAFYINCSGAININKDYNTIFGAGGGAGDNIELSDLVDIPPTINKFASLKTNLDSNYLYIDNNKFNYLKNLFNNNNIVINKDTTTTKGSSLLYQFFDITRTPDAYQVFGGAGGGFGKGTGINAITFINDANILNKSDGYNLKCIIEYGKGSYSLIGGN